MSVDSLLCEVTPNLGLRPYIQAADQLYYKDQRVLSDVKAETSGAGQASSSSGQGNKGKGGNKNQEGGRNRQDSRGGDKVRQAINEAKQTAQQARGGAGGRNRRSSNKSESGELTAIRKELDELREDNASLRKEVDELRQMILKNCNICPSKKEEPKKEEAPAAAAAAADDDFDLFGSEDEDDEEKKRITEERLKAYAEKKSKKPGPIAKSNIIYDVKPWDDTIKIEDIEAAVRGIQMDGLVWGASKKVPVAFGLNKLQIMCVVEDDKVSSDSLEEAICAFEDLVQSVDIVAFNKV